LDTSAASAISATDTASLPRSRNIRVVFGGAEQATMPRGAPVTEDQVAAALTAVHGEGWKLAATVRGQAPDGLLDSYQAERHPVGARILAITRAQGVLMNPPPDADDVCALREIVIDAGTGGATGGVVTGARSGGLW